MTQEVQQEPFKLQHQIIHLPVGLAGFEAIHNYMFVSNEDEAPFLWLQSIDDPSLAFLTIDPFLIYDSYLPDIPEEDVSLLDISSEEDVFVLSIVNINNPEVGGVTANLVSPLVINWKKKIGKQVILENYHLYSVRHRIEEQ